jgi:Arc/MetJ family transcription regulator
MRADIQVTDAMLANKLPEYGIDGEPSKICSALRAIVVARIRAELHPNPKVSRPMPRPRAVVNAFVSTRPAVDRKCLAANDLDEE